MRAFKTLIYLYLLLHPITSLCADLAPPKLSLAHTYHKGIDVGRYWVSEKFDGVRAYWDGKNLITRQGNIIHAPDWFLAQLPNSLTLDGELWIGRGKFELLSGAVRKAEPEDSVWRTISYRIFDLPDSKLEFSQRLLEMQQLFAKGRDKNIILAQQFRVGSHSDLMDLLENYTKQGAEGLMLHLESSYYRPGRSNDLLKLKTYKDAEARVIRHFPGQGKYSGLMGSLLVQDLNGLQFRIGTGFSVQQRKSPPPIGSIITFKYYGKTKNGIPRFASFMRIRE